MNQIASVLQQNRWPIAAIAASVFMLAAAHAFERFALLAPCPLCLRQREVYWAVIAMAGTGLVLARLRQTPRFMMALNVLIGLVFVVGAMVAIYHAGVEWRWLPAPDGCAAAAPGDILSASLDNLNERQATASCLDAPWVMLGLSMAGWNALASLALAALSLAAAFKLAGNGEAA